LAPLATLVAGAAAFAIVAALPNGGSQTRSPKPQSVPTADAMYLTAVEHAAQQPTGKYWMSDVVEGASWLIPAKTGPYVISAAGSEFFQWTAAAKGAGEAYWGRGVRAFPLTAADRAAWRRAGAPSRFRVWANDHYDVFYASNDEVGSGQGSMSWQIDPSQTGGGTFNGLTLKNLSSMPTAPAALKNWIEANVSRQTDTRNWLSDIATFMENAPLQPAQRSAVMRMLLDQPGVTTLGSVRDLLGRTGVAIGSTGADLGYATRSELFFDQHTGAFLGTEEVLTKPGGTYASMPAGTILGYWLLRSSGWTNTKPAVPHARASPPTPTTPAVGARLGGHDPKACSGRVARPRTIG
jgi:hypothetical protein